MKLRYDYITLVLTIVLISFGLVTIYSATGGGEGEMAGYFVKQSIWAIFGIVLMIVISFLPHKLFSQFAWLYYAFSLLLLLFVLFFGKVGQGAERWLVIGSIHIQPSESAKLATILAVAAFLSEKYSDVNKLKYFAGAVGIILLPFFLIARQPDLGTAIVFLAIILPMLYWAGLNWFYLFVILTPVLTVILSFHFVAFLVLMLLIVVVLVFSRRKPRVMVAVFLLNIAVGTITPTLWNQLRPYQKQRILTFINPEQDPRGAGYQIIQSQVAIGSGGFWGKGYLQGSQTHLRFLPAQHTDFIFSVIGEEFGFLGVGAVLLMFLVLLLRLIQQASVSRQPFGSLVLIGVATVLAFHVLINVGMTIGLAPVTGLPLPFLSYGGSFLVSNMIMMGVVLNLTRDHI